MRVGVDVWCVDLAIAPPPSQADLAILSEEERGRHAAYLVSEPARIFATTRVALRRILATRMGVSPSAVSISLEARGKPYLAGRPSLSFNVSHCATLALIALSESGAVGVDVEIGSLDDAPPQLASAICTAAEVQWLRAHPTLAGTTLSRLWSRKEAVLKAQGSGLADPMSRLELGNPREVSGMALLASVGRVVWSDLHLDTPHVGSIALVSRSAMSIDARCHAFSE